MKKFIFYGELTDVKLMTALSSVESMGYKMVIVDANGDTKIVTRIERLNSAMAPSEPEVLPPVKPNHPVTATSPVPKVPEIIVSNVSVKRVPDGSAVGVNGRKSFSGTYSKHVGRTKFHHPSGRTASDFILEYVRKQGTTTRMDIEAYISSLGFNQKTASAAISMMWGAGQIEVTGVYVGWPKDEKKE